MNSVASAMPSMMITSSPSDRKITGGGENDCESSYDRDYFRWRVTMSSPRAADSHESTGRDSGPNQFMTGGYRQWTTRRMGWGSHSFRNATSRKGSTG